MAESNSSVIHKLVSAAAFAQWRVLPAVLLSILASLLLLVAVLSFGAIFRLAAAEPAHSSSAAGGGLLALAADLDGTSWQWVGDRLIRPVSVFHSNNSSLTVLMGVLCVAFGLRWLCSSFSQLLIAGNAMSVVQRLRQHIHRKAIRLEPADLTGEQSRATDRLFRESSTALEKAATAWGQRWVSGLPDLLAVTTLALLVQWRVSIQVIVPVVLCWFALRLESQRSDGSYRLLSEQVERGLQKLAKGLQKTRIVTGFSMQQPEQQQFEKNLLIYRDRCRRLRKQQEVGRWMNRLIILSSIFIPGYLLVRHVISPPALPFPSAAIIAACSLLVFQSLQNLQPTTSLAEEAKVRADEINGYIARVPLVGQTVGARFMEPMARTLVFDQVTLSIPQYPRLLNNLDLKINFGETIAMISLNPLPAYALASMVPRFVDPDAGQVLIDGQDIRQATLESLRAEVVFVGSTDPLFNTTALENVTCGQPDIDRHQVQEACKLVHADHFIRNLPKGYDTIVGEHGAVLEPGQAFRLNLARAVARKPALLIVEEPVHPLDTETKAMLDDAYQRISAGRTLIFLPSRLSTVKKCDRIILIHDGRVTADDTHEKLVRTSELYRHWEYMRFNAFREESELTASVPI